MPSRGHCRADSAACFPSTNAKGCHKPCLLGLHAYLHTTTHVPLHFLVPFLPPCFSSPPPLPPPGVHPCLFYIYITGLAHTAARNRHMEGNGACPHCSPHSPFPRCCASRRAGRSSLGSSSWRSRPSPSAAATQDQGPRHRPDPPAAIGPRRQDRGCRAPPGRSQASPKAVDVGSELSFYELRW